jgi:hypothetical protein
MKIEEYIAFRLTEEFGCIDLDAATCDFMDGEHSFRPCKGPMQYMSAGEVLKSIKYDLFLDTGENLADKRERDGDWICVAGAYFLAEARFLAHDLREKLVGIDPILTDSGWCYYRDNVAFGPFACAEDAYDSAL